MYALELFLTRNSYIHTNHNIRLHRKAAKKYFNYKHASPNFVMNFKRISVEAFAATPRPFFRAFSGVYYIDRISFVPCFERPTVVQGKFYFTARDEYNNR